MLDPYVTLSELVQNLDFVREMKLQDSITRLPLFFTPKLCLYGGVPLIEKLREEGLLREKGLEMDYVFKDKCFRLIYGISQVVGKTIGLVNRFRQ